MRRCADIYHTDITTHSHCVESASQPLSGRLAHDAGSPSWPDFAEATGPCLSCGPVACGQVSGMRLAKGLVGRAAYSAVWNVRQLALPPLRGGRSAIEHGRDGTACAARTG